MPEITRVGVLCVHGMGNQSSGEHVAGIARGFFETLKKNYGPKNVSISYEQGSRIVSVHLARKPGELVVIDLVEGYWRDLGEPRSTKRLLRFWWWALTLWATKGFRETDQSSRGFFGNVEIGERIRLFFHSMVFFILLLPIRMILSIISYVPFVNRIDLFATIYAYMSSVKIYQENPNRYKSDSLFEDVESRRVWIQRRFANHIFDMADRNYDRWGIFCHSLGSVIVYKGLQYHPCHWAWFLDQRRAQNLASRFLTTMPEDNLPDLDIPKRPLWIGSSGNAVKRDALFAKFIGVVSYGSPIETFAKLWPRIIDNPKTINIFSEFKWVNLYDIRDFISSQIVSACAVKFDSIRNISVDSHWLIFKAHTEYLRRTERNRDVSFALFHWFLDNNISEIEILAKKTNNKQKIKNVSLLIGQAILVMVIGILLLPLATSAFVAALNGILGSLLRIIFEQDNLLAGLMRDFSDWINPFHPTWPSPLGYLSYCATDVCIFFSLLICAGIVRRVLSSARN